MSSYKNSYVPWRGSGTSSFSTGVSQTNNSSNPATSTSTTSKYSAGISGSKQELSKQKESSFSSSNTSSTGCHSSTGLSRFSSTRSSIGSSAGSNALNSSNLSTNSSSIPKRENSFRENASSSLHREKSGVGSTNSIRDKIALSTSSSSAVKDKTSNASSLVREKSGLSSTSIKREKSNAGSTSYAKEKANTTLENKISNSLNSSSKLLSALSNDASSASSAANAFRPSYLRNGLSSANAGSTPNSTGLSTTRQIPSVDLLSSKISSYEDYGKKSGLNSCATSGGVTGLTGSGTSSGNANTSGNTNNASNTGALGYRLFSARNIAATTNTATNETKPIAANTAAMTSSLRTTARFGLRSGTSHAHYSSSLPSAVVKGLGDETKSGRQEASKSKISDEPVTWMSRGTSPNPPGSTNAANEQGAGAGSSELASEISAEVAPTINPNHDITIVVKHKAVQTDDKLSASPPTLHKYISSIPRPSTTYYSPFNAAMSRFASNKSTNNNSALDTNDSKSSPINNNNNSKSPGSSSTTTNDQSRTSHPPSPHTSPSRKPYETVVGSNLTGNSASNKASTGNNGIVVTLPNKEFRKSALNVGLETREAEQEFAKKQEQLRFSKEQQNSVPTLVISGGAAKRDIGRRPPTDPNKSNLAMNGHQSRSMNRLPGSGLVKSASINPNALTKAKSGKNILPIRKNSTSSCSESESSSSMSSSSTSLNRKKGMSFKSCNLPPDKGQGRRGSVTSTTSCSSAASSRSSSSERSRSNSKTTASTPRVNNHQSQSPTRPMGEMHDTNGNFPNVVTNTLEEGPKQTSFLLRALASTEERLAWVRRCESGEIPWWMASNPNIPGLAPKNPSSATLLMKSPTAKQIPIQEEASTDSDETDTEDNLKSKGIVAPLEERTSPDGREIASNDSSPKATLSILNNKAKKNTQLFIGNMTNIDDILGTFSPSPVPPTKDAPPEKLPDETYHDEKNSSDESSDDLDDDDGSSDDGSTGTSSSFEEVDPSSITIHNPLIQPGVLKKSLSSSSSGAVQPSIAAAQIECVGSMDKQTTSGGGLIPISQREKLDDATLQLYKDGDYGTYLDLEASISEQQEEFDGFVNNKKNSIILRAQLPVRVHAIIEKLLNSDGRELRRALFSLKQIFQEDKDLVHEFVENGGLSCLIKVGSEADQNYQNYILRAIGQVMLYVDGMCGVMRHNETIQWLYSLVASKFRLVQKTALKLLLVFVDYIESNCLLLVQAVRLVDILKGSPLWSNIMSLLRDHDSGDTELLVYAMTLVNKVLNGIPDIDTYYDQVDALEEQGMATLIQKYMGKQCADLDLLQQFQIYEVVLKHEDGEEDNIMMQLDESMRQKLLNRKGYGDVEGSGGNKERRKSRRHSANGTPPSTPTGNGSSAPFLSTHPTVRRLSSTGETRGDNDDWSSSASSSHSSSPAPNGTPNGSASPVISNGYAKDKCISNDIDVTPGLRKRRERAERQKTLQLEQKQVNGKVNGYSECNGNGHTTDDSMGSPVTPSSPVKNPESISLIPLGRSNSSKKDILSVVTTNGNENSANMNGHNNNNNNNNKRPWKLPVYPVTNGTTNGEKENSVEKEAGENEKNVLKRENTVKDLTQKLANQSLLTSPVEENKSFIRTGDLSGVVSKAKEGLAKSKSRVDIKPPQSSDVINGSNNSNGILETKKSDNELHWDFLVSNLNRPLEVCDLDFTDLTDSDDADILAPSPHLFNGGMNGFPPPVPSMNGFSLGPPPPPPGILGKSIPPPPMNGINGILSNGRGPPAPPLFGVSLKQQNNSNDLITPKSTLKKTKKTVKLFWKEVREDPVTAMKIQKVGCIWDELSPIPLDTQRLEHLFESRAKDVITKKQTDMNKSKEIVVLDPKRSNAINIGMTKLPPPRTIKAAIMKMDATIINREGIEKLLTMLPTEEERAKIQEAQFANPEIPLGSAEQFLLTLASISELTARLKLWAFKLDYENLEKEVAEPLMDLKQGIEALEKNKTFRCILTTLLCIGNFLNGAEAKGFQIEYLVKVPEVKDTVHKHSLLHHLCHMVIEKFSDSTDLYSEIGPVTRASRVDFDELATNLAKMETDCKASWDHLRVIAKHDGPTNMKLKMSEFLADCAERIIVLGIVHHRVNNRYHKFLLWLGVLAHQVTTTKPHTLFKIISEFALEYRTTRERVLQQLQKKANHRERNKTRGKMITEQIMYKTKEDKADAELRQVLKATSDTSDGDVVRGTLTWTRRPKHPQPKLNDNKNVTLNGNGTLADGDDEILESLVKTATQTPATRAAPRERKRNNSRYSDRKSLRRTLRNGLSDEDRKLLAAYMATGHRF